MKHKASSEQRRRILIADDSPTIIEITKARLEAFGYEVITAADGEEALQKTSESNPDLILLDIMMPKMDGYETAKRLKENEKTSSIPIIMITAVGDPEAVTRSMEIGAADYIAKPFEPKTLLEKIRKALK